MSCLYILEINPVVYIVGKYFLAFCGLSFHFCLSSYLFILTRFHSFTFVFIFTTFVDGLEKISPVAQSCLILCDYCCNLCHR